MNVPPVLQRLLGAALLLGMVVFGATLRFGAAVGDPNFDTGRAEGMLKSDPALLYYLTERVLEAGGGTPDDWRADPRIQHPRTTDVPAEFTVGQEFLVAWARLASGSTEPLHVFAQRVMALFAALLVVGAYVLVLARTRSVPWALVGAALVFGVAANYRTLGFILVREDVALPLYALHLGLVAWALARPGPARFLAAGLAAAAALSTWHAMGFVLAIELAVACLGLALRRRTVLELPGAPWALVPVAVAGLVVPALWHGGTLVSLPAVFAAALLGARLAAGGEEIVRGRRALGALGGTLVVLGLGAARGALVDAPGAYAHVHEVLLAKLVHLGVPPEDPTTLSFDARLLWQGPFETLAPGVLVDWLGPSLWGLAVVLGLRLWRRDLGGFELFLAALALASLPVAWLVGRMVVLPGLFVPAVAVTLAAGLPWRRSALAGVTVLVLAQGIALAMFLEEHRLSWYLPPGRQPEIAALVEWVDANVPEGEALVGDFMTGTALLAHTGRPIALQPKYETDDSRRRAEAFFGAFFQGTPEDLARLVKERFEARYLFVDRLTLWYLGRYTGGVPWAVTEPRSGTAAAAFLAQEDAALRSIPGFELVYRSPPHLLQSDGRTPYDLYRVYRLR